MPRSAPSRGSGLPPAPIGRDGLRWRGDHLFDGNRVSEDDQEIRHRRIQIIGRSEAETRQVAVFELGGNGPNNSQAHGRAVNYAILRPHRYRRWETA